MKESDAAGCKSSIHKPAHGPRQQHEVEPHHLATYLHSSTPAAGASVLLLLPQNNRHTGRRNHAILSDDHGDVLGWHGIILEVQKTQARNVLPACKGAHAWVAWEGHQSIRVTQLIMGDAVQLHALMELEALAAHEHRFAVGVGCHSYCCISGSPHDRSIRHDGGCTQEHLSHIADNKGEGVKMDVAAGNARGLELLKHALPLQLWAAVHHHDFEGAAKRSCLGQHVCHNVGVRKGQDDIPICHLLHRAVHQQPVCRNDLDLDVAPDILN
mmetsp:Transcript_10556/g.28887  ORF Transcript_10556/g.28887 Transcript_10556/m.28887 type:complete len:270 (-) Transcript_10556:1558-2367(-)